MSFMLHCCKPKISKKIEVYFKFESSSSTHVWKYFCNATFFLTKMDKYTCKNNIYKYINS